MIAAAPLIVACGGGALLYRIDPAPYRAALDQAEAARAAFFPRISLTAALGTLSPDPSSLFASGTRTWTFAPLVQLPIFAGGGRARVQRGNERA